MLLQILLDHSIILLLELDSNTFYSMEMKQNKSQRFSNLQQGREGGQRKTSRASRLLTTKYWCGDKINYPIQPDGKVGAIYLILYFEEYRQGFLERKEKQIQKLNAKQASSRTAQDGPLGNVLLPGPPDQQSVTDRVNSPTDHSGVSGLRSISAGMQPRTGVRT